MTAILSRLRVGSQAAEGTLLAEVPIPADNLLRVLAQALELAGTTGAYPALMAVGGEAFRVPAPRCVGLEPPRGPGELGKTLAGVGRPAAQVRSAAQGLLPEEIVGIVAAETAAGRPVLLGGWRPAAPGWALLAGTAPGDLVCGYGPFSTSGDPYLAAPAQGDLLIALGPAEPVSADALFDLALAAARACWENPRLGNADLYRAWLHLLGEGVVPAVAVAAEAARALAALVEGRAAARDYLEHSAERLLPATTAGAERAADLYVRVLDLAEPLSAALNGPGAEILWAQPDWRAEARERLEQIAELDAEAVNCLRRAAATECGVEGE